MTDEAHKLPRMKTLTVLCAVLALSMGCDKKSETSGDNKTGNTKANGGKAGDKAKPAPAKAAAMEWMPVGALGLSVEAPAGTKIDDKTQGAGFPTATIWASPTTFVTGQNDMFWKKDIAGAKAEIEKDPNKFQAFTKEEATADGFHLEFTLESMMDKKPIYGVKLRRKIGEKMFDCGSNTQSEELRAKVLKLCQSLKPAS